MESQAVQNGGEHTHVVGGGFLDDDAVAELVAAQQIAAADDDGELHAALDDALRLASDGQRLVDADAGFAGVAEPLTAELQEERLYFGRSDRSCLDRPWRNALVERRITQKGL